MYLAGLDIHDVLRRSPLSHAQGVESIMWLTTLAGVVRAARRIHKASGAHYYHHRQALPAATSDTGVPAPAGANIGGLRALPPVLRVLSPLAHGVIIATPVVYLVGTVFSRMEQPEWFSDWALPEHNLTQGHFALLRVAAAVANYGLLYLLKRVSKAIDASAKAEKPSVPTEGPYSVIRHPMSSALLLTQATYALMWWNWIPVASFVVTGAYLAVSLRHEEKLSEEDVLTGAQYTAYKEKVKYRLIPYVW